eukprot:7649995-Pyramimonas_sp.AAC.1
MTDDNTIAEKTTSTRTVPYLDKVQDQEPQEGIVDDGKDNPIYDAMANLLGIDDDSQESGDKLENGETLTETEALDCLAALIGLPPKPRTR